MATESSSSGSIAGKPQDAVDIIAFSKDETGAAAIRYDIPLPGRHSGRRITKLDLGLQLGDFTSIARSGVAPSFAALNWTAPSPESSEWTYDAKAALDLFFQHTRAEGVPGEFFWGSLILDYIESAARQAPLRDEKWLTSLDPVIGGEALPLAAWETDARLRDFYHAYINGLSNGHLVRPKRIATGVIYLESVTSEETSNTDPSICLIEVFGITSFLDDYGLGQTIRTFSLLPGEETKLSLKTWRSSSESVTRGATIVDSYTDSAGERFNNTVQAETTDKNSRANKSSWQVEASVEASFGFGSAKVSGGAAGEFQESRDTFAKQVSDAVREHTSQATVTRSNTVTSSSEVSKTTGQEELIERTIKNVNLRRVLNFVFRELNQKYDVRIHLLDVRIGFTNGTPNSWREVSIGQLRPFLEEILEGDREAGTLQDEVAADILSAMGTIHDLRDSPVILLEKVEVKDDGVYEKSDAKRETEGIYEGRLLPPPGDGSFFYRVKRGKLGQGSEDERRQVDGVLLQKNELVMPTDSVVIEALLGRADALDEYSMYTQLVDVEKKKIEIDREREGLRVLRKIEDSKEASAAYARMFNPRSPQQE